MKNIFFSISLLAVIFVAYSFKNAQTTTTSTASENTFSINAKNILTDTIKVSGVCTMCKKRIETAVYGLAGIKTAVWDVDTQLLFVSYNAKKTSNDAIQKRIAGIGHDTEKYKATDKVYNTLHHCCRYREDTTH
jgi:periplasmic mercuric ion binding protein